MKIRLLTIVFALLLGSPAFTSPTIEVWKSTTCECCGNWIKHLEANGFDVTVHTADTSLLDRVRKDAGIPDKLAACHTAKIDGYFIEGHVPGTDIKRLINEKPDAIGLTVPGMPMGGPGMEQGMRFDKYDVLLIKKDGRGSQGIGGGSPYGSASSAGSACGEAVMCIPTGQFSSPIRGPDE